MFQLGHIITATQMTKHFAEVVKYILDIQEPMLITQKSGQMLVLLTSDLYEALSHHQQKNEGREPPIAFLREIVAREKRRFQI